MVCSLDEEILQVSSISTSPFFNWVQLLSLHVISYRSNPLCTPTIARRQCLRYQEQHTDVLQSYLVFDLPAVQTRSLFLLYAFLTRSAWNELTNGCSVLHCEVGCREYNVKVKSKCLIYWIYSYFLRPLSACTRVRPVILQLLYLLYSIVWN